MTSGTDAASWDPREDSRQDYVAFESLTTRWADNDVFGHLNNAVYLELFDTALNNWFVRETGVDETTAPVIGVVVESTCRFHREVSYPGSVDVGIRVGRVGRSSIVIELGLFRAGADELAAACRWVQVYIDVATRKSAAIPDAVLTLCAAASRDS